MNRIEYIPKTVLSRKDNQKASEDNKLEITLPEEHEMEEAETFDVTAEILQIDQKLSMSKRA